MEGLKYEFYNNGTCKLEKKGHLCGSQHDCPYECQKEGFCEIETFVRQEEEEYITYYGEKIIYKTIKFQKISKIKCRIKIQSNEFSHIEEHFCKNEMHKCGFQCRQCEYHCTDKYGHDGLHSCLHGNIKNSFFKTIDLKDALVRKDNQYYLFQDGETAKIYFCDSYCRDQGQGHTHLFESKEEINNNDNVKLYIKTNNINIYQCKCIYFWKNILKFKGNFNEEEKNKFNLCDWKCDDRNHKIKEYCQLSLWHDPLTVNFVPNGVHGNWVCKGHVFKCIHPNGNYFIFLVDQSGSMQNNSIKPTTDIGNKLCNKLGASIEAIINFCKKRYANNKKDIGALIGFNSKASLIFENISLDKIEEIKKSCLQHLIPQGKTYFIQAFKEASKILEKMNNNENDNINRRNYNPVIILLTDGLDHNPKETISFLENEVSNIFYNIYIYS